MDRDTLYFQTGLKWVKSEGRESEFLLKKWRKNGKKNAKYIERSAGAPDPLHNRCVFCP